MLATAECSPTNCSTAVRSAVVFSLSQHFAQQLFLCRLDMQRTVAFDWINLATGTSSCDWIHSNSWFIVAHVWMYCCLRLDVQATAARTETPLHDGRNKSGEGWRRVADGGGAWQEARLRGIQLAVGPQPLRLRNHDFGLAQRIMVKRLATSRHDPLGITGSACKNQLVVVIVQYDPFNTYIPIRSTTIGKSRVARDPIAMHTSWRSNSDIASVTRVSMTFRVVRTNQYNQDLGLIHSTNGNHLKSPNEGSSIDHQVTIHLHAQNITMFPTNETMVLRIADASLKLRRPYPHFDGPID
ncbi:hypothetical protein F511_29485 [Dorcoceras hygrometricum]|uniref:Uncharacterized protein n=1 Tax=Dorcoceras hygrometricum TaxID=472368 RepID=A0A2Z7B5Q6_9LAMI|nr:hypothetical protein F511_29485 [Dorcoceras hygrometricum]